MKCDGLLGISKAILTVNLCCFAPLGAVAPLPLVLPGISFEQSLGCADVHVIFLVLSPFFIIVLHMQKVKKTQS